MYKNSFILLLLLMMSLLWAEDFFEDSPSEKSGRSQITFELNGFTRGAFFGGKVVNKKEVELKSGYGELGLKCRARVGEYGDGYAEIRFRSGSEFGSLIKEFNLREAYVNTYLGNLDIRFGHQIVVWGRADGFNPTNNITPQNMIARSTDEDDRKIGNFLLRLSYDLNPFKFEGIWVPKYASSVLPTNLFPFPKNVELGTPFLPDDNIKNSSIAIKSSIVLGPFDGSVSYFRGYMPMPGISLSHGYLNDSGSIIIVVRTKPYKMDVVGADFSTSIASFGLRGEFAFRRPTDNYKLRENIYIPNPDFQYVIGVDRTIRDFNIIVQYIGRYVWDFEKFNPTGSSMDQLELTNRMIASQQHEISHAVFIRPSLNLFHETCQLELLGYYNITTKEWLFRPAITYYLADALTAKLGWDGYSGPEGTLFGNIKDALSSAFIELKVSF